MSVGVQVKVEENVLVHVTVGVGVSVNDNVDVVVGVLVWVGVRVGVTVFVATATGITETCFLQATGRTAIRVDKARNNGFFMKACLFLEAWYKYNTVPDPLVVSTKYVEHYLCGCRGHLGLGKSDAFILKCDPKNIKL